MHRFHHRGKRIAVCKTASQTGDAASSRLLAIGRPNVMKSLAQRQHVIETST